MIIDAHAHVFLWPKMRPFKDSTTLLSVEEYVELMDRKGIDKAVVLPIGNPEAPYEFQSAGEILLICSSYPGRFIPFCNVDPRMMSIVKETEVDDFKFFLDQYKDLGFKGIGEIAFRLPWTDPHVLKLLRAAEQVGFPVTFHGTIEEINDYGVLDKAGLPGLEYVLAHFPELKILGHGFLFWAHITQTATINAQDYWQSLQGAFTPGRVFELLRKYPNLYCDISAGSGFKAITTNPQFGCEFISEFSDRIVFGQDYCSMVNDMRHLEWLTESRDSGRISNEAFQKITGLNIGKILNLTNEKTADEN